MKHYETFHFFFLFSLITLFYNCNNSYTTLQVTVLNISTFLYDDGVVMKQLINRKNFIFYFINFREICGKFDKKNANLGKKIQNLKSNFRFVFDLETQYLSR